MLLGLSRFGVPQLSSDPSLGNFEFPCMDSPVASTGHYVPPHLLLYTTTEFQSLHFTLNIRAFLPALPCLGDIKAAPKERWESSKKEVHTLIMNPVDLQCSDKGCVVLISSCLFAFSNPFTFCHPQRSIHT